MADPAEVLAAGPVRLRRLGRHDADVVYRIVLESLEHLLPWMPWAAGFDRAAAVRFVTTCDDHWTAGTAYNYEISVTTVPVGICGLMRRGGPGRAEIGYWLHPAHLGRGLATAAAAALVTAAFALPDIDRVEIIHDAANTASAGVPHRLGFTQVGRRTPAPGQLTPAKIGVDIIWRLTRPLPTARPP